MDDLMMSTATDLSGSVPDESAEVQPPYVVYVLLDEQNRITAINSSAFLTDTEGWLEIDQGYGDKRHHAQGNYLDGPIMDMRGRYRYKIVNDEESAPTVAVRSPEEMEGDDGQTEIKPSIDERLTAMEVAGLERDQALMELAAVFAALMEGENA